MRPFLTSSLNKTNLLEMIRVGTGSAHSMTNESDCLLVLTIPHAPKHTFANRDASKVK